MTRKEEKAATKQRILTACVKLFIEQGYYKTTLSAIVKEAGVSFSSFQNIFKTKDGVLLDLAKYMFEGQFDMARSVSKDNIKPAFVYAAETAIQMTITELNENLREIYVEAYSNPAASEYLFGKITEEVKGIFAEYNPTYSESDFYELVIGSAGLMRNYMARKCDQYFNLDRKLMRFLTLSLKVYNVPEDEIKEAIEFVKSFDIREASNEIMQGLFRTLAMKFDFTLEGAE